MPALPTFFTSSPFIATVMRVALCVGIPLVWGVLVEVALQLASKRGARK